MAVHADSTNGQTHFEQFTAMRGVETTLPVTTEGIEVYFKHLAALQNSQFEECHPNTGLEVQDVQVPVTFTPDPSNIPSDPFKDVSGTESEPLRTVANIPVRIYRPTNLQGPLPLIVWFHGGYLVGDISTEDATCRNLSRLAGSVVLNVGYRTLPFPTPFRDGFDVVLWAITNASTLLQASPHRGFHIGGASHGAHVATTIALHASKIGLNPPFTGQVLRSPVTLHPSTPLGELDSMQKSHPLMSAEHVKYWWSVYNPPEHLISSPSVSPLLAEINTLPPSYLQITTADPHADEGLQYAAKLRENGVPVKVTTYEGEPHAFWDLPRITGAVTAMQDLIDGLRWLQSHEQLDLNQWDTGIREEAVIWYQNSAQGEGETAWKRKKLCHVAGCGCYM